MPHHAALVVMFCGLNKYFCLCSASYVSCKHSTARICCCVPCCGLVLLQHCAGRAAIDRYLLSAGPTAANPPQWAMGRTDTVPLLCTQCQQNNTVSSIVAQLPVLWQQIRYCEDSCLQQTILLYHQTLNYF